MSNYKTRASIEEYRTNIENLRAKLAARDITLPEYIESTRDYRKIKRDNIRQARREIRRYEREVLDYTLNKDLEELYRNETNHNFKNAIRHRLNRNISDLKKKRFISYLNPLIDNKTRLYRDPSDQEILGKV